MESWMTVIAGTAGTGVFFAGIAVLVWLDQRGKVQQRELEHRERMSAIERGQPLEDAARTRYRMLGAIALVVPIVAFVVALTTTIIMLAFKSSLDWPWWLLTVLWGVAGLVSLVTVTTTVGRMDRPTPLGDRSESNPNDPDWE